MKREENIADVKDPANGLQDNFMPSHRNAM